MNSRPAGAEPNQDWPRSPMQLEIFVPFYGDPMMLQETVRSVLAQDDPRWSLTVVDDGYPDPSVAEFFSTITDPRVRYLRNDRNLGANGNYRKCLALAVEDLLVILGADDQLLPNYVRTIFAAHTAFPLAAVIQPGVEVIDEFGQPVTTLADKMKSVIGPRVRGRRLMAGQELAISLMRGDWLYFPSLVFARQPMVDMGFRDGLDVVQDLALVIDLVCQGRSLVVEDTVCFRYRRHRASDSSVRALAGSRFVEERAYFRLAAEQLTSMGWSRAARVARRQLISRLNAMTLLPKAVLKRNWQGVRILLGHALGRA